MEDELATWCGRINLLSEASKLNTSRGKSVDRFDELLKRAAYSVEQID